MLKLKKILVTLLIILSTSTSICSAGIIQNVQDRIGTDKIAHFGVGYILSDQLKKHTKMSALERTLLIGGIAVVKELNDKEFDRNDIFATVLGAVGLNFSGKF